MKNDKIQHISQCKKAEKNLHQKGLQLKEQNCQDFMLQQFQIKQIYHMSNPSPIHSPLNTSVPKKEEWALINQQKAREYERVQQLEREMNLKKKLELRKQLQKQFNTRTDASLQQREFDRQYYEYISKKTEEMKQQEDRERAERFLKRKQIQQENQHHLGLMQNSRVLSNQEKYKFDIGGHSQQLHREKQVQHKKQMIDTLDKQVKIKADQKRYQKQHQLEIDNKNLQYQFDQFDRRNPYRAYGQNKNVYNYYDFLNRQRQMKEKQLEHIFVDEAAERKKEEERKKIEKKQIQKASKTNEMKEVLQKQVELYHHKMEEQKKTNPQDIQYTVFGSIFREKKIPYDRRQYSEYLRKQAQEQANRKKQEKYMSDQQYRINMNQLNKAVRGNYAHGTYIDRSIGAIGERHNRINNTYNEPVKDQDRETVEHKLQTIRSRNKPYHYEPLQRSF